MKEIAVKINAGFPRGGGGDAWSITVEDASSGANIVSFEVPIEAVGAILSARQGIPGTARVFETYDKLGLTRERRTVRVPCLDRKPYGNDPIEPWQDYIRRGVAEFEVDGWKAAIPNPAYLRQRQIEGQGSATTISVDLIRYVAASPKEVEG